MTLPEIRPRVAWEVFIPQLPPDAAQAWVVDELGYLIDRCGRDRFVQAPLRLPTEADFPDPWQGDMASLEALLQRLLGYADLGGLRLQVERFAGERSVDHVDARGEAVYRHHGAAAWFGGLDRRYGSADTARFGCEERLLDEAGEALVGVLAHEVAHAFRHAHGLVRDAREEEEQLTDLTTIYLGFGVFTVNNTHRYRTGMTGDMASSQQWSRAGYLSPETMSFALGAQLVARELSCWQAWRLLRWLEPNQRGYTRAALASLRPADVLWNRLVPPEPPIVDLGLGTQASGNRPPAE